MGRFSFRLSGGNLLDQPLRQAIVDSMLGGFVDLTERMKGREERRQLNGIYSGAEGLEMNFIEADFVVSVHQRLDIFVFSMQYFF